ncbi:hypothetical protein DA456_08235 [Pseudomonas syringae pv. atrofaciens]|uniref:Uncharacterized protein n=1 Tax=Pseudomonas syringae pv. atrofaciens TaxID=192087 RepID=A0AAD0MV37_PSESX|nr:hypothetical protein DA456_08235 [Pseudomonas syringae pv. atrofaciens]KFF83713.1 hypothetical protein HM80_11965 [Pseudomonas syringae pv. syringae]
MISPELSMIQRKRGLVLFASRSAEAYIDLLNNLAFAQRFKPNKRYLHMRVFLPKLIIQICLRFAKFKHQQIIASALYPAKRQAAVKLQ